MKKFMVDIVVGGALMSKTYKTAYKLLEIVVCSWLYTVEVQTWHL